MNSLKQALEAAGFKQAVKKDAKFLRCPFCKKMVYYLSICSCQIEPVTKRETILRKGERK